VSAYLSRLYSGRPTSLREAAKQINKRLPKVLPTRATVSKNIRAASWSAAARYSRSSALLRRPIDGHNLDHSCQS